jgi:hypothetical protein
VLIIRTNEPLPKRSKLAHVLDAGQLEVFHTLFLLMLGIIYGYCLTRVSEDFSGSDGVF